MKPLIIFQFDQFQDFETIKEFEKVIQEEIKNGGSLEGYNCIVFQGTVKISVHYPNKPIRYYYNKLKAWVILKIWKRKIFSNTSVIL